MVNLSGIGSRVTAGVNNIGSHAYAGYRILANKAKCGDTFKAKYATKIAEKAKADFMSSSNIKTKTFIALGAGIAAIGAGVIALVNKASHKPAEKQ